MHFQLFPVKHLKPIQSPPFHLDLIYDNLDCFRENFQDQNQEQLLLSFFKLFQFSYPKTYWNSFSIIQIWY
jgi:hypothetical protein